MTPRLIAYVRVSTAEQAQDGRVVHAATLSGGHEPAAPPGHRIDVGVLGGVDHGPAGGDELNPHIEWGRYGTSHPRGRRSTSIPSRAILR